MAIGPARSLDFFPYDWNCQGRPLRRVECDTRSRPPFAHNKAAFRKVPERSVDSCPGAAKFLGEISLMRDLLTRLPDPAMYPSQQLLANACPGICLGQRQVVSPVKVGRATRSSWPGI